MNESKKARIEKATQEAALRQEKALRSLALCLSRSDVMRIHHDTLVKELLDTGAEFTDTKNTRFSAYKPKYTVSKLMGVYIPWLCILFLVSIALAITSGQLK